MIALELGVTALMAATTAITARRHPPAALGIVLVGLLLASASVTEIREVFLTARWGGLVALPVALFWPPPRRLGDIRLELAAMGITLVLALSALWSIDPELTLMRAASFGLLIVGVTRAASPSVTRWSTGRAVDVLAVLPLVVTAASLLLWLARPDIAVYVGELRGVLENQNGLGLFVGLTFPFVLAAVDRRWPRRISVVVLTLPTALLLGLAESRAGALALVAGIAAYELSGRFPRRLVLQLLVASSAFLAVSLSVTSLQSGTPAPVTPGPTAPVPAPAPGPSQPAEPPSEERPDVLGRGAAQGQGRFTALLGARDEAWGATVDLIADRPLLGYGFGAGDRVFARYPERATFVYFQGANPNSGYLQALLELGALFGLFILLPLVYALAVGIRATLRQPLAPERAAFLACLAGGLAAGAFESLFTAAGAPWALLIWLSAAVLIRGSAADRNAPAFVVERPAAR